MDTVLSGVCPFYVLDTMKYGPSYMAAIEEERTKVMQRLGIIENIIRQTRNDCELDTNDVEDEWGWYSMVTRRNLKIWIPQVQRKLSGIESKMRSKRKSIDSFKEEMQYYLDIKDYLSIVPQDINSKLSNASASNELRGIAKKADDVIKNNKRIMRKIQCLWAELNQISRCDALVVNDILVNGVNTPFEGVYTRSYNSLDVYVQEILRTIDSYQEEMRGLKNLLLSLNLMIKENSVLQKRYEYFTFTACLKQGRDKIVRDGEELLSFCQEIESDISRDLREPIEILQKRKEWRANILRDNKVCSHCGTLNEPSAKNCGVCGHYLFRVCLEQRRDCFRLDRLDFFLFFVRFFDPLMCSTWTSDAVVFILGR